MNSRIVIVGGVAGGATAAAKARRQNENAEITLFERGPYISFANCGLPYFISGEIKERESLLLTTPEKFGAKYNIKVQTEHEVLSIDREQQTVLVRRLSDGTEFSQAYDRLILSQGASPLVPPFPGVEQEFVFTLRNIPDMQAICDYLDHKAPQTAVVIGGGFIGLEMAEAFYHRGLSVNVIEAAPHVLPRLEDDLAAEFKHRISREGFVIRDKHKVVAIGDKYVTLDNDEQLPADLVLMSIGVKPENEMAKAAGLEMGPSGGIKTNGRLQSSDPNIYAIGDMAEVRQRQTGAPLRIPLAGPANRQGRVAGANAAGGHLTYPGALGTSILRCLNTTVGMVGLNAHDAEAARLNYSISVTRNPHHATYYPGAEELITLLIAEEGSGRLLGAQVMGTEGVDKRLDVLATAITGNLCIDEIESLDLAYAPPFGSANDAINTAAFVMGHELRGDLKIAAPHQAPNGALLLDVRNPDELKEHGMLKGAMNIPLADLRERLHQLDPKQEILVYCQKGQRGYLATRLLMGHGFQRVRNLKGGFLQAKYNGWLS